MNLRKFDFLSGFAAMVTISLAGTAALETGAELKLSDCPAAVQKTFQREANGAEIKEISKDTEDEKTTYEASVTIDEMEYEITVCEDGTLIEKALEEKDDDNDDKEGEVTEVKLADCPATVQKTLKREANGADIDVVDKETKDGKAIYEVDVQIDGKNYEVMVADDGLLISKALDEEDE